MSNGGGAGNASFQWNTSSLFESTVKLVVPGSNLSFAPNPVCVWPPFGFVLSNSTSASLNEGKLNCMPQVFFYSLCWDGSKFPLALVTRKQLSQYLLGNWSGDFDKLM